MLKTVTALCCNSRTAYRFLPGVEYFDQARDARTFSGGTPVVAHPPCRPWISSGWRVLAKPLAGEENLAWFCLDQVMANGGILEHPAGSRFWAEAHLPRPGCGSDQGPWCVEVQQSWWGFPFVKPTWLLFVGVPRHLVLFPLRLHQSFHARQDERRWKNLTRRQRAETTFDFARWLVDQARLSTIH